jgi:hypothetical protein
MRILSRSIASALTIGLLAVAGCGGTEPDDAGDASDQVEGSQSADDSANESTTSDRGRADSEEGARTADGRPDRSKRETENASESSDPSDPSDSSDPSGSSDSGESGQSTLDPAALDAALLSLDDLPSEWTELSPEEGDGSDTICGDDMQKAAEDLPRTDATYALDAERGPRLSEAVRLVGDRGPGLMALAEQTIAECDGKDLGDITIHTAEVPLPDLGDESVAYRIRMEYSGQTFDFGLSYVLVDDTMLMLFGYDFTTGDPFDLLREYAPIAVDKALAAAE